MKNIVIILLLGVIVGCQTIGGSAPRLELFVVHSPADDLRQTTLAATPLLTDHDIVSYDWATHTVELTAEGVAKLPSLKDVGVSGLPFVVVANGERCYMGAFWTHLSSISHARPVIVVVFAPESRIFHIQRAYPADSFAKGDDPRSDKRVFQVLTDLKKLKKTPDQ